MTNGHVRGLPVGMRVFTDRRGNAAVVVNDPSVECVPVSELVTDWGVCVWVKGVFGEMYVLSVYCKFGDDLDPYLAYLDSALLLVSSTPTILGMDANASSPLWFSKMGESPTHRNHYRGVVLSDYLVVNSLHVLNEPSEWHTFSGVQGKSDIDVTVVNDAAMLFEYAWRVRAGWTVSDHNVIEVTLTYERAVTAQHGVNVKRWRTDHVDWQFYGECLKAKTEDLPLNVFECLGVDDQVSKINEWVTSVNDDMFERYRKVNPKRVKWWSRDLSEKRKCVRRLRKQFQRARANGRENVPQLRVAYQRCMREYKCLVLDAKERDWKEFVSRNKHDPWGQVYRICRGNRRHVPVSGIRVGNTELSTWNECVRVLMSEFFPAADSNASSALPVQVQAEDVDMVEIHESFLKLKSRKSPGLDGMTGEMCKAIWRVIPEYLGAMFRKCVSAGYFPKEWKSARVIVLLKSPDKIRSNPRSYRGISLLPALGKVLERIMVNRLQERVRHCMSERQYGFRAGKCVEDAWLYVKECVKTAQCKYVLGVFVDFKGAFDYLSWESVLQRLSVLGCPEIALWQSYFSDRRACVIGVNECVWCDVVRGCPQGSICGPFIWDMMMDPLLTELETVCECSAYADDLFIMLHGESRLELERKGEEAMRMVTRWGSNVGVSVAMDKTVTMLLKGKLSLSRPPHIKIDGASLKYVTQVKYLGITMSERMGFDPHLASLRGRISLVVGQLRRVLRCEWGLSRKAVRAIYGGLFVACAAFGASAWYETAMSATGKTRLESCQRCMLLACLPVCRTVSTEAMQVLMGVAPLDLEIIRRAIQFKIRRGIALLPCDVNFCGSDSLPSVRECSDVLKERLLSVWQDRWDASERGRVTQRFIPSVRFAEEHPFFDPCLSLGFLLTGHGSMNGFLHERGLSEHKGCMCGADVEDALHVLCECPIYSDLRNLGDMGIAVVNGVFDVSGVLCDREQYMCVTRFACEVFKRRRQRLRLL